MPIKPKTIFIASVDIYLGKGTSLTEAYENLREIAEDAQSPDDCTFYQATIIPVKMELIPTIVKD